MICPRLRWTPVAEHALKHPSWPPRTCGIHRADPPDCSVPEEMLKSYKCVHLREVPLLSASSGVARRTEGRTEVQTLLFTPD